MADSQPARRFVTEGAVIVVSILLAFSIDAWWDSLQARRTEATVLESIREEAEENRREMDTLLGRNAAQLARIDMFLASDEENLRALPQDSLFQWLAAMVVTWTFDGDDSAAGLFLDSSTPVTDHAREVRSVLARWVRIADDLEEEKQTLWDMGADLAGLLTVHVAPAPSVQEGQGLLHSVAAKLGPGLLAELRADDAYVAALLNKAHYQAVYAEELKDASAALDSLRFTVGRDAGTRP